MEWTTIKSLLCSCTRLESYGGQKLNSLAWAFHLNCTSMDNMMQKIMACRHVIFFVQIETFPKASRNLSSIQLLFFVIFCESSEWPWLSPNWFQNLNHKMVSRLFGRGKKNTTPQEPQPSVTPAEAEDDGFTIVGVTPQNANSQSAPSIYPSLSANPTGSFLLLIRV